MGIKQSGFNVLPARKSAVDLFFSSSLYKSSLKGRIPKRLLFTPVDIIPGDAERADRLFHGNFLLEGLDARLGSEEPWFAKKMPLYWHQELHKFGWLKDFAANGSDSAKRHARSLITNWIARFDEYHPHIWDADILARRLLSWMQQSEFLLTSNDGDFNYKFIRSIRRQMQHLKRYCRYFAKGDDLFLPFLALYTGSACFKDSQGDASKFKARLLEEIDKVILPDGCHVSRAPDQHLNALTDLINLRETLRRLEKPLPENLIRAIDRLAPAVRFFQHGDGKMALFDGSLSENEGTADHILALSEAMGRPPLHLPHGGFERVRVGRSLVIMETGQGGRPKGHRYHGAGAIEFSHGRDRIVVNCGAHPDISSPWAKALAATAAHSTLSYQETNAEFKPLEKQMGTEDPDINVLEDGGNIWIDFTNRGYEKSASLAHTRRLFMDESGTSLRGEDTVKVLSDADKSHEFIVRFHLHPDLSLSRAMNGRQLLLMTPEGIGWQFISSLSELKLEESIYCSQPGEARKSQQIVLRGQIHGPDELSIKWAFHQMGKKEEA
ncbi:MAG: heparinase II/III family protein [Sneathiella sp.]|nr:heparinase II/III family protein [Sneathiella sp.]